MYGVQKYLSQSDDTNRLWYSEPLQQVSTLVGAVQVATIDYGSFGAKFILISAIIVSSGIVAGAANLVTFTDQFNRTLFVMDISREGNSCICIEKVIPGHRLFVSASFAVPVVANYFFTVQHQYLREVDKIDKAKF